MTVQVQIRRSDGSDVSLDDCAGFSGPMGEALESQSLLTEAYVLEISSPGIGDQLRAIGTFRRSAVIRLRFSTAMTKARNNGNKAPFSNAMTTMCTSMCVDASNAFPDPL